MDIFAYLLLQILNGVNWKPEFGLSSRYKHWIAALDLKTSFECRSCHGEIWLIDENSDKEPPLHPNCRCTIKVMKTVKSGTATINGKNGADWFLKNYNKLPDYYIDVENAGENGWKRGKWLSNFAPGKMMTAGIYRNDDFHLPNADNRIWYEADINYKTGKRNTQRILWSSDGLVFVTFDHYKTFLK